MTLATFVLGFTLSAGAVADTLHVEAVQKALLAKKAGWVAKENWLTKLPKDQLRRMMGVQTPPSTEAQFSVPGVRTEKDSTSIDWRNKDGGNYVSPLLNQGNCGSCVAFATVGALETQVNVSSGIPGLNPTFSTQALFVCGGGACEFGWQPDLAAKYLQATGVPDEACAPYTMGATGETVACSTVCKDATARSYKIVSWNQVTDGAQNIEAVKAALAKGPLITTLMVYEDFITYSSGIYKHTTGTTLGGHAVSIVGYDDATRVWIIRNSWGPEWGESGFARVSWDDVSGISDNTIWMEVPTADGYVSVKNPLNRDFLSGTSNVKAESTFKNTSAVQVKITSLDANRTVLDSACIATDSANPSACAVSFDSTTVADGSYDVVAIATVNGSPVNSQHEHFYVFNSAPKLTLSFVGDATADLTKPITDRVVFDLTSSTGSPSVPLHSIAFHVKNGATEVYTKGANIVLPQMTMGWRTPTVANGTYEIYFTGEISTARGLATVESNHMTVTVQN